MRTQNRKKKLMVYLSIVIALTVICQDLATSKRYVFEEGTFRYESEFDAITSATTKVAIVPSDYSGLSTQVSRSTDPSYEHIEEINLLNYGTATPHNSKYHVHKAILKADVYISVPVLKIHNTGITNALCLDPGIYICSIKSKNYSNNIKLIIK